MKKVVFRHPLIVLILGIVSLGLTSCEDRKALEEIERLEADLDGLEMDFEREKERRAEANDQLRQLRKELAEAISDKRVTESELASAKRVIERFERREEAAKVAEQRPPSRREKLAAGKGAAAAHVAALVTIEGEEASGNGFLVSAEDKVWLYFSPKVLEGSSKLEVVQTGGVKLTKFGAFELAEDVGMARMEVKDEVKGALSIPEKMTLNGSGDLIGIGADGLTVEGRFYGQEAAALKIDTRLSKCNLGAPVFDGESAQLFGVMVKGTDVKRVLWESIHVAQYAGRKQVARLDRKVPWTSLTIGTFKQEKEMIAEADAWTRLLHAFVQVRPNISGLSFDITLGSGETAGDVLGEYKTLSPVRSLFALDEWLRTKGSRASEADRSRKIATAYEEMERSSDQNTKTLMAKKFSPLNALELKQSLEWRRAAEKLLGEIVAQQK